MHDIFYKEHRYCTKVRMCKIFVLLVQCMPCIHHRRTMHKNIQDRSTQIILLCTMQDMEELAAIVAEYATDSSMLSSPVAYFELDIQKDGKQGFKIDFPRKGRIIVVKMIESQCRTSSEAHRTIDVRHIAFYE